MNNKKSSNKKYSHYEIDQKVIITHEDNGIPVGVATILDNLKVKRNGKYANKVVDSYGKIGYVKLKYIED